MHDLDIKPIPEEAESFAGETPRRLERVELRVRGERQQLRAVFRFLDKAGEADRVLSWTPSTNEYDFVQAESDMASNRDTMERILERWSAMFRPDDFEKMRQQLGLSESVSRPAMLKLVDPEQ